MHNRKMQIAAIVIIFSMLIGGQQVYLSTVVASEITKSSDRISLIPISPIGIFSESDLSTMAISNAWPGNGSVSSPYVIANYSILDLNNSAHAIEIQNTRSYIELKNIVVSEALYGLFLLNTSNIMVTNLTVLQSNYDGIRVEDSNNIQFDGLTVTDSTFDSIRVHRVSSISFTDTNISSGPLNGFSISSSELVKISDTVVANFSLNEIYIISSNKFFVDNLQTKAIVGNTIDIVNVTEFRINGIEELSNSSVYAFRIVQSKNGTIDGLTSFGALYAGFINEGYNITIQNSEFFNNTQSGIVVDNSDYVLINSNKIVNSFRNSIFARFNNRFFEAVGNTITNTIEESGIVVDNTVVAVIQENIITGSGDYGIVTRTGESVIVENNDVEGNVLSGAFIYDMRNTTYKDNSFANNILSGIDILSSTNLELLNNIITQNQINGIYAADTDNSTFMRNSISYQKRGVLIENSYDLNVTLNQISSNSFGITLNNVNMSKISQNTIDANGLGLKMVWTISITIANNNFVNNSGYAIESTMNSNNSTIISNNMIENNNGSIQVISNGTAAFSDNFWSDLISPDADEDGVVDVAYNIEGGSKDNSARTVPTSDIDLYSMVVLIAPVLKFDTSIKYNESVTINWREAFASKSTLVVYDVEYSADNGSTWVTISSGLTSTSTMWDTLPLDNGSLYRIRVIAKASSMERYDISETFVIENIDRLKGLSLSIDKKKANISDIIEFTWTAVSDSFGHDIEYILYYSVNGTSFVMLQKVDGQSFSWNTTGMSVGNYTIKIVAQDGAGQSIEATTELELTQATTSDVQAIGSDESSNLGVVLVVAGVLVVGIGVIFAKKKGLF